ncbi:MAG: hypothetical protein P8Z30_19625, partial [Acidobacteriota bacterium]
MPQVTDTVHQIASLLDDKEDSRLRNGITTRVSGQSLFQFRYGETADSQSDLAFGEPRDIQAIRTSFAGQSNMWTNSSPAFGMNLLSTKKGKIN